MARGWESKSVEAQQQDAESRRKPALPVSPDELQRRRRLDHLNMNRTRILSEIQHACNPRFRAQLDAELRFLDAEIAKLAPSA
jgi:hypothetical protein